MKAAELKRLLFPAEPRLFRGQRWLNIGLRCTHLVGIAGIGGGLLFGVEESRWLAFWYLTVGSGAGLVLLYLISSVLWLFQLKGLVILFKLVLLSLLPALPPDQGGLLFLLVVVLSGLIAHAPGAVRGYCWWKPAGF